MSWEMEPKQKTEIEKMGKTQEVNMIDPEIESWEKAVHPPFLKKSQKKKKNATMT
jgi:hypothetical protein